MNRCSNETIKNITFRFMQTGIRKCDNGSWQVTIKNCKTNEFKVVGYDDLQKILNK